VSVHNAATPEGSASGRGGLSRDADGSSERSSAIITSTLPAYIVQRLAGADITTFNQWRELGASRRLIFGITKASVKLIDAAAAEALGRAS
jgi:hypothetical protein